MHAEELKHKPIGTIQGIFITLGIVFGILFCIFVVNFLQFWLQIYWLQFILYGLMILVAFLIVKNMLTEYIYLVEKDRITFGRKIGKREKELLFIPFRDVVGMDSYAEKEQQIQGKKRYKFTFRPKADWYVIDCRNCVVILSPTQEYIDCLSKAVKLRTKE